MSSQNTPSHENGPFQPRPTRGPLRDSTMGYSICEPGGVMKNLCPVFWSRMKYSPGDESASFRMRAFAISRVTTASRQSTSPPLILKMSREGTMFCPPPFLGHLFVPTMRYPVLFLLGQWSASALPGKAHHFPLAGLPSFYPTKHPIATRGKARPCRVGC